MLTSHQTLGIFWSFIFLYLNVKLWSEPIVLLPVGFYWLYIIYTYIYILSGSMFCYWWKCGKFLAKFKLQRVCQIWGIFQAQVWGSGVRTNIRYIDFVFVSQIIATANGDLLKTATRWHPYARSLLSGSDSADLAMQERLTTFFFLCEVVTTTISAQQRRNKGRKRTCPFEDAQSTCETIAPVSQPTFAARPKN